MSVSRTLPPKTIKITGDKCLNISADLWDYEKLEEWWKAKIVAVAVSLGGRYRLLSRPLGWRIAMFNMGYDPEREKNNQAAIAEELTL